jgi:hypothetical protein
MGQTSDPETLVIHQKTMPGNNPEDFMQHYDRGRSLQSHIIHLCFLIFFNNLKDIINVKNVILFSFQYMPLGTLVLHNDSQQVPKCIPPPPVLNLKAYSP